jgi:AraC-like DNA-binding protein
VPVLTIAMDAGFQSIGPFNRAFKAATDLTPTEFRRRAVRKMLTVQESASRIEKSASRILEIGESGALTR